ncbi:ecdysteroid kinase domain-containing protein [Ditylenchus destructor]|nr:ecdysteroid kinase domain-containing protein [Ditylenchus destructor]
MPSKGSIDFDSEIGATIFTPRFILERLTKSENPRWKFPATVDTNNLQQHIKCINVEQITGHGFLSLIYRVSFAFFNETTRSSVILKVPSISVFSKQNDQESVDGFLPVLVQFHNKETHFYNAIGNSYPSPMIPKVFASRECTNPEELERSFLIMQDRKTSGGVHADFSQGLTKGQIESVLAAIAEFHAYTLSLSVQLMESLVLEKPFDFVEGSETLIKNLLKISDTQYFTNNETVLRKFFATHAKESFFDCHKRFGIKPVLCHGDLWANNVFYKTSDTSNSSDELHSIFDWQCAHPNTGLNDIAHLLLSSATAELLSQHETEWLQLYFDVFTKKASELSVEPPFDFELMQKIYQYHYPAQLMFVMLVIEVVLNAERRPEMRRNLIYRMIAGFEKIRRNYE